MITLAIDTSTPRGAVALLRDEKPLAEEFFDRSTPGQNLFDATAKVLAGNHLAVKDLGLIAIGLGPGSFTGVRSGIAAAKGLALPGKLPVTGASSFDALALTALPKMPRDCPQMCVLGDARRDEVYFALYDREGRCVKDCRITTLEAIADEIHNPIWFVSPEIERFKSDIASLFGGFASICQTPLFPSAAALGWLAVQRFHADADRGDEHLEPIYLRVPDYRKL
jgi:tRNA threonylcarbamoyladenosine biosynthesis protein TsaB